MGRAFAVVASGLFVSAIVACASNAPEHLGTTSQDLDAYCTASVSGQTLDVETDYLPHVDTCENGDAPTEALKAQAVAARTYLYYDLAESGSISAGAQAYSCATQPGDAQKQAVSDTSGLVLQYKGKTIAAFYVAGGDANPPACIGDPNGADESDVTYNEGKSGSDVTQSPIGEVDPSNDANRGCMSQNGSACLASAGQSYVDILKFYYGEDIEIVQATGACVTPAAVPDGGSATSDGGTSTTPANDGGKITAPSTGDSPAPSNSGGCAITRENTGEIGSRSIGWLAVFGGVAFALRRGRNRRRYRVAK